MEKKNTVQETMSERLKSQTSAQKTENNSQSGEELITREQIEGTPFQLITTNGFTFLALGRYRMTQEVSANEENKTELRKKVENKDWNLVLDTIIVLIDSTVETMTEKASRANPLNNLNLKGLSQLQKEEKEQ